MALTTIAVTQRNREDYSKTILLNTDRVLTSRTDSDGKIVFVYLERKGFKPKKVEYKCSLSQSAWTKKFEEANRLETQRIHSTEKKTKAQGWFDFNKYQRIKTDTIVGGVDINGSSCYLMIDEDLDFVTLKTTHLISEIAGSSSKSTSLSRS